MNQIVDGGSVDRRRCRQYMAVPLGVGPALVLEYHVGGTVPLAILALLVGAAAGFGLVRYTGARGWAGLWLLNGALAGWLLGLLEGVFSGLIWLLVGVLVGSALGALLWAWIQHWHEATARRLASACVALVWGAIVFALPLGLMGLLDLGWSDDVGGVMVMGAIMGAVVGAVAGWRGLKEVGLVCLSGVRSGE
ncbi:MAG: hypothetical protein GKR89_03750 [Candidatus Latescibacteria bacterium]|nr:hypothetical protein [Candidatus Latescibacterota bacterium]